MAIGSSHSGSQANGRFGFRGGVLTFLPSANAQRHTHTHTRALTYGTHTKAHTLHLSSRHSDVDSMCLLSIPGESTDPVWPSNLPHAELLHTYLKSGLSVVEGGEERALSRQVGGERGDELVSLNFTRCPAAKHQEIQRFQSASRAPDTTGLPPFRSIKELICTNKNPW